jgi:hypothetical protein
MNRPPVTVASTITPDPMIASNTRAIALLPMSRTGAVTLAAIGCWKILRTMPAGASCGSALLTKVLRPKEAEGRSKSAG